MMEGMGRSFLLAPSSIRGGMTKARVEHDTLPISSISAPKEGMNSDAAGCREGHGERGGLEVAAERGSRSQEDRNVLQALLTSW